MNLIYVCIVVKNIVYKFYDILKKKTKDGAWKQNQDEQKDNVSMSSCYDQKKTKNKTKTRGSVG